jgi:hypothetical protein
MASNERINNILITDFEEYVNVGGHPITLVRIVGRYGHTPVNSKFKNIVVIGDNQSLLRAAVRKALDYARADGFKVYIQNRSVVEDIEAGAIDITDFEITHDSRKGLNERSTTNDVRHEVNVNELQTN